MKINEWTRDDNLPLGMNFEFSHIREDAEVLGDISEDKIVSFIKKKFEDEFSWFWDLYNFNDVVFIEIDKFDDSFGSEEENSGHAVYIHFKRNLVLTMLDHVKKYRPEHFIANLDKI